MQARILDALPPGLLDRDATELAAELGAPTLVRVEGETGPPLFVSVLLHGNETSGWNGLRQFLIKHPRPRRSLLIFIGNVFAAADGVRALDTQQDFNRIWRDARGAEGQLGASVMATLNAAPLFAAVDLHNNTGRNPHYSVVTELDPAVLGLAGLFSDKAVYIVEPDTTLGRAFRGMCPAVTLELGPVGDPRCDRRALDYLETLVGLRQLPAPDLATLKLYRALGRVHVREDVRFSFAEDQAGTPLVLTSGMEAVNFHELPAGTEFGVINSEGPAPLQVLNPVHTDVTAGFLAIEGRRILTRRPLIPAMYTTDPRVIRQDCLCYFMERIKIT